MNRFTGTVEELRQTLKCTIIVIHHCGKDDAKEERGSSALRGNLDSSIKVIKTGNIRDGDCVVKVENQKVKDGPDGNELIFDPKIISLGFVRMT